MEENTDEFKEGKTYEIPKESFEAIFQKYLYLTAEWLRYDKTPDLILFVAIPHLLPVLLFHLDFLCRKQLPDMEYMVWEQNHIRFLWFDTDMSVFPCEIPFLSAVSLRLY